MNAKEHSCNHSIGVAIIRATLVPPRRAKVTLLGRKRKRGRKPQAAPAWQHQPFDIVSPQHHPQQSPAILTGVAAPPNGPLDAQNAILEEHIEEPKAVPYSIQKKSSKIGCFRYFFDHLFGCIFLDAVPYSIHNLKCKTVYSGWCALRSEPKIHPEPLETLSWYQCGCHLLVDYICYHRYNRCSAWKKI